MLIILLLIFILIIISPLIICIFIFFYSLDELRSDKLEMKNDPERNLSEDIRKQKIRMTVTGILGVIFAAIDVTIMIHLYLITTGAISLM